MACLLAGTAGASGQEPAPSPLSIDVIHYDATIEPDIAGKTVKGRVGIEFSVLDGRAGVIELDSGGLVIDSVTEGGAALVATTRNGKLRVPFGAREPREAVKARALEVTYHGAPRYGLEFVPEKSQVYTIFSTSQWMVCIDAPGDRATFRLNLILPKGLTSVGNGVLIAERALDGNRINHEWRLDRSAPTYTFGFAAGRFKEVATERGATRLRFLADDATEADLRRIFSDTGDMLDFFEDRAGAPYPDRTYTQALVAKTIGQEATGFGLVSEAYGQSVLADPTRLGLLAHELAHQWWGNSVTCEDWTHFWLNEGFATFMAAAYREKRFGKEAYAADVQSWRDRYERVKTASGDKSLVFPNWNRPTSDDRALVYQKGTLVLHELRALLGETDFWDGVRQYTRGHMGQSVRTEDFQSAMEKSTGKDLSGFFGRWVYLGSGRGAARRP